MDVSVDSQLWKSHIQSLIYCLILGCFDSYSFLRKPSDYSHFSSVSTQLSGSWLMLGEQVEICQGLPLASCLLLLSTFCGCGFLFTFKKDAHILLGIA